ncbi:hypothetical protein DC094_03210 [Pelagibaculum spongiae]|uniref:Uncharacterized protein n=1 Tax=Pelagibaculum spongiae TaxID=2080658 RepID=A0A2V1H0P3_9GAMM|nr:hypothetical protein DC094_03210 [Pelagibaculum spongiae]
MKAILRTIGKRMAGDKPKIATRIVMPIKLNARAGSANIKSLDGNYGSLGDSRQRYQRTK